LLDLLEGLQARVSGNVPERIRALAEEPIGAFANLKSGIVLMLAFAPSAIGLSHERQK